MTNYFHRVLYLYPDIEGIMYWYTQQDGTPWNDSYDGLIWNNNQIAKPTKAELDALDDATVEAELNSRKEAKRKQKRDEDAEKNITVLSNYDIYKQANPTKTLSEYLDYLEALA